MPWITEPEHIAGLSLMSTTESIFLPSFPHDFSAGRCPHQMRSSTPLNQCVLLERRSPSFRCTQLVKTHYAYEVISEDQDPDLRHKNFMQAEMSMRITGGEPTLHYITLRHRYSCLCTTPVLEVPQVWTHARDSVYCGCAELSRIYLLRNREISGT